MKSLTLLMYKAAEGSLEVRARDLDSKWLTALAALDDETYTVADNSHNLVGAAGGWVGCRQAGRLAGRLVGWLGNCRWFALVRSHARVRARAADCRHACLEVPHQQAPCCCRKQVVAIAPAVIAVGEALNHSVIISPLLNPLPTRLCFATTATHPRTRSVRGCRRWAASTWGSL